MVKFIKKNLFLIILIVFAAGFFWQFFVKGLLPVPADTIVGLYHPFLDYYSKVNPAGIPFQNFLITDPVRQIIPWKVLVIDNLSNLSLPLWNPYEMAGKPLMANFQSATFYPFNLLLFVKPFDISWSIFIILQPILAASFMYLYLKNLKLDVRASFFGASSFALGGFAIAWLEWGNIIHTALWLPLILLSIDKIFDSKKKDIFGLIFLVSITCSFFAGHLQTFFYIFLIALAYTILRFIQNGKSLKSINLLLIATIAFVVITSIQWVPTLQFINLSARALDQNPLTVEGWFIPPQHLLQFIAPDFFGNPATLNYWGVWNYAEFSGYIGIIGLFFALFSLFAKKTKETIFFAGVLIASLVFVVANPIASLPFSVQIPFISSAQPTRLIFLVAFSLSVLSAFGLNSLLSEKNNKRMLILSAIIFAVIFLILWLVGLGKIPFNISAEHLVVAKRNLILPTGILAAGIVAALIYAFVKEELTRDFLIVAILVLSLFDLYRFGSKFTPFTNPDYFYPKTSIIEFLQKQKGVFRIAATDSRILAPNISTYYKIQSIEGYDPLYLTNYAQLIAASERNDHSIKPPYGFNRIITPRNTGTGVIDLLNVKYVLSFTDLPKGEFDLVFSEGSTKVYQNKSVIPRAFFVTNTFESVGQEAASKMFGIDLSDNAFVENMDVAGKYSKGNVSIESYGENRVVLATRNSGKGFLVLSDSFYPTWKATIDGEETTIYKTNINFRGVVVPEGRHVIEFKNSIL